MTPSTTIFVRTYTPDAPWLHELFRSIDRHVSGFDAVIVHCDPSDRRAIADVVRGRAQIVTSPPACANPYLAQQTAKLLADYWVKTPYVLYADSDMAFVDKATPESFFLNNKPHLLYTPYDVLGATVPWRETVERIMKEPVMGEGMRGPRLIHVTEALPALRNYLCQIHGINNVPQFLCGFDRLSEFNLLFAYVWKFCQDRYSFSNTCVDPLPRNPLKQWWSKGGITPDIRAQLEAALA